MTPPRHDRPARHLTRRRMLHCLAAATGSAALLPTAAAWAAPAIDFAALERSSGARIGVFAANLNGPQVIDHRADDLFALCSTFKTYAAAGVLQQVDGARAQLAQPVFVDPADIVANSPITGEAAGRTLTLAEVCQAALQRSDNTAGNLLLRQLGGPPAITAFARSVGDDRTRLDRFETALNAAAPGDPRDTGTPRALAAGYLTVLTGDPLSPASRDLLTQWMRANQTSSMRAGLPAGWVTADKTGGGDYGSTNDIGIAYGPAGERLLLAVMIRAANDDPAAPDSRPLIGQLAGMLVTALTAG